MSTPVRVRRLSDHEGRQLQQIVRRGSGKSNNSVVKWRRALVVLASAGGNDVAAIAKLVQTSPDRVREMIHRFNEKGLSCLDPVWAGGRPRRITTSERAIITSSASARPTTLGQPFTRWSIRKLERYLATRKKLIVSRERLRQILAEEEITFQATKTWKESPDPLREVKLARIEHVLEHERDRTFSFDEFGPLAIKPEGGRAWAKQSRPVRLRADYHKPHGTRQLFSWFSVGDNRLYGRIEVRKGATPTLRALKAIRALRPDDKPIYVSRTTSTTTKELTFGSGARTTPSSCASHRPTRHGRTPSRHTSGRCESSRSTTATIQTTSRSPTRSATTSAGATRTPATQRSSPSSASIGHKSAVKPNDVGDNPNDGPPDQWSSARTFVVRALARSHSRQTRGASWLPYRDQEQAGPD